MEQNSSFNYQPTNEKIYKEREIWVGTLLGGVLAAGYMVAQNYKAFGERDKVRKTWFVTVAALAFLFYISFFAPYLDRVPNSLFTLIWAGIIIVLVQIYQGEQIRSHSRAGRQIHSWWKTIGVSIIGAIITAIIFLGFAYVQTTIENANIETKYYGTVKDQVSFDKRNVSPEDIDVIAKAFTNLGFFNDEAPRYVYVRKVEDSYEISISVYKSILSRPDDLQWFAQLRNETQKYFPQNKIVINLVTDSFDNVIKQIE